MFAISAKQRYLHPVTQANNCGNSIEEELSLDSAMVLLSAADNAAPHSH
jgi:hypothetical protein